MAVEVPILPKHPDSFHDPFGRPVTRKKHGEVKPQCDREGTTAAQPTTSTNSLMTGLKTEVERVFSLLACMFGDQQANLLGDFTQGSLMLRYNKREAR
jgi:hypothetical protein